MDRHLWMLAFDILFVNLDAPINFGHNYYLYQDDAGRLNPIIWDLNENFGVFQMLLGQGPGSRVDLPYLDLFFNSTSSTYPIVSKVLSNPTYKIMYVECPQQNLFLLVDQQLLYSDKTYGCARKENRERCAIFSSFAHVDGEAVAASSHS